jgi:predicted SAM-dependent methyltransferase
MDRDIPPIHRWDEHGLVFNLGCGKKIIQGAINLDLPSWDANLNTISAGTDSTDCVHAYHFLEHLDNPIAMLAEIQRVLKPGGVANIVVPYYNSQMSAQDLSHKSVWCETTWQNLFKNTYYMRPGENWRLRVHLNIIIGVVERNLCLMTQLVKE